MEEHNEQICRQKVQADFERYGAEISEWNCSRNGMILIELSKRSDKFASHSWNEHYAQKILEYSQMKWEISSELFSIQRMSFQFNAVYKMFFFYILLNIIIFK